MNSAEPTLLPTSAELARTAAHLLGIPIELLYQTSECGILEQRDFYALSSVCRYLHANTQRYLYATFSRKMYGTHDLIVLANYMAVIDSKPELAARVKRVAIESSTPTVPALMRHSNGAKTALAIFEKLSTHERLRNYPQLPTLGFSLGQGEIDAAVAMMLIRLPNVEQLAFTYSDYHNYPYNAYKRHNIFLLEIKAHFALSILSSLTNITLICGGTAPPIHMNAAALFGISTLREVTIQNVYFHGLNPNTSGVTKLTVLPYSGDGNRTQSRLAR